MVVYDAVISDRMLHKVIRVYIIDRRYSLIYGYILSLLQYDHHVYVSDLCV